MKRENLKRANEINEKLTVLEKQRKLLTSYTEDFQISIKSKSYHFMDIDLCTITKQEIKRVLVDSIITQRAALETELEAL